MTMTFSLHESIEPNSAFDPIEMWTSNGSGGASMPGENYHLISEKLRVPAHRGVIERPRLISLANKSIAQFPATLISGRAGTGKTAFAASFAAHNKKVCWYSVESTDAEWSSFARYFSASLLGVDRVSGYAPPTGEASEVTQNDIARFLVQNFAQPNVFPIGQPALIVLDDIHHIFDALWFDEFFNLLLYSLPGEAHLLMLCRSRPPGPLMRLRSKQMLNLLEEKVIAFTEAETEALLDSVGLPTSYARDANRECFGRISKLLEFVRNASTTLPSS